jgi:hypothetical protein
MLTVGATGAVAAVTSAGDDGDNRHEALNYPTRYGIDPEQTKGQASVALEFKVPMLADLPVDDVGISVKAAVRRFRRHPGQEHQADQRHGEFRDRQQPFASDRDRQPGGCPVMVDWVEDFKTSAPITSRINVKGQLTDGARAALGVDLAILTGPVAVNADLQGNRGDLRIADASLDLTQAAIAIPILNLGKAAGLAAGGRITVNFGPNSSVHDEVIRLTGPNVTANGTAQFDGDGRLTQLNFSSVKMGALNDLSVILNRTPSGEEYILRGHSLDGSMIGRNGTAAAGPDAPPTARADGMSGPFHINARLDRWRCATGWR